MKILKLSLVLGALLVGRGASSAGEPTQAEDLQRQLLELKRTLEQEQARHQQQMEALQRQLETLQQALTNHNPAAPASALAATPPPTASITNAAPIRPAWSPSDPIRVGGSRAYLNLSMDALMAAGGSTAKDIDALELGGHDPKQNGFTLQSLEMVLDGAVDPFFRGQANLLWQIDSSGESRTELEEVYATTTSLPANLQLKAGQFLTDFGRLNATHPHTWAFADAPLVNGRFFGEDGLRNPGLRASWLVPTPFYSELFLAVQNSHGGTASSFRDDFGDGLRYGRPGEASGIHHADDLLFVPRYAVSFDLTDNQTLLLGTSAAFGPNGTGQDARTQIYGLDWYWKWKPANQHGGFPFVSWQTEGMVRRYQAGAYDGLRDPANPTQALPAETLLDYGLYSQVAYGFHQGWVAALRGDYVNGDRAALVQDPDRALRWRVSPSLTWYPSEYSKIRLQYNYDWREWLGNDHSVWLQLEILLGSHAAHKF